MDKEFFLQNYRHSMSHILAKAVIELWGKDVQYAIGPQVDDGFYYDFKLEHNINKDDYEAIENKMRDPVAVLPAHAEIFPPHVTVGGSRGIDGVLAQHGDPAC